MRLFATIFRLLGVLSLLAFCALIWFKFDTQTNQQIAFLDEVIDDAYSILQSDKEEQWKDIADKKSLFNDAFDAGAQIESGEDNPLLLALEELQMAEDKIFRDQDYGEILEDKTKEYGPGSLYWDSESKLWKISDNYKLESPIGFMNPFADESSFPYKDKKLEDGTILKGVPRHQRLRTVIGMFYKARHDKQREMSKLREMIVQRDEELRKYQNLLSSEKSKKDEAEDQLSDAQIQIKGFEQDIEKLSTEKQAFEEAAGEEKRVLTQQVTELNDQVIQINETHKAEIEALADEHKRAIEAKQKEITKADADGYQRGIEEMLAKQQGGEVAEDKMSEEVNPFMIQKKDFEPPSMNDLDNLAASQRKKISEMGAPSTISRVDSENGMMLLPIGSERGVGQGSVFTVWKDKREAARIRVQSSRDGFLLAYILPRFGEPEKLRPGDSIYIIPEKEQEL